MATRAKRESRNNPQPGKTNTHKNHNPSGVGMLIPLDEKPQFRCSACGSCCSHIRGFIPEQDREFLKEYAFGRMPVVQLVPVERMTFPLWDWEASRFRQWGAEAGLDSRIKLLRAIYDT